MNICEQRNKLQSQLDKLNKKLESHTHDFTITSPNFMVVTIGLLGDFDLTKSRKSQEVEAFNINQMENGVYGLICCLEDC